MNTKNYLGILIALFILCPGKNLCYGQNQHLTVNKTYSPPWWQTLICTPDDPVKTLVGKEGQIYGDFNYNGPRNYSFSIQFDGNEPLNWKSQNLTSARIPILHTVKTTGNIEVTEETFLHIPPDVEPKIIVRYDARKVLTAFSKPVIQCDPLFYDAAAGISIGSGEGSIDLHLKVLPASSQYVALGFCEGRWKEDGKRIMRVEIEGAENKVIDPVKDFGYNTPGIYTFLSRDIDADGILLIAVTAIPGSTDRDAILNGLWVFNDTLPSANSIILGKANDYAHLYAPGTEIMLPERKYSMLIDIENKSEESGKFKPVLRYAGVDSLKLINGKIQIGNNAVISSTEIIMSIQPTGIDSFNILMEEIDLSPGEIKKLSISISRFSVDIQPDEECKYQNILSEKTKAENWWKENFPSISSVLIPDQEIQDVLESSIRNILQSRDIRKGKPSFHVGPTCYRGLWIADGSFLLETATMLGYIKDTRECIKNLTGFELPEGGFEMIPSFYKENGLVLFMLSRHAMLTQDKNWLEQNWPIMQGCVNRIEKLRDAASEDKNKSNYGLLPAGFVDGGIRLGNDYSNTQWCLAGMKWAIKSAKWLGKNEEASAWKNIFDDFYSTYISKVKNDLHRDDFGNTYLPVLINNKNNLDPQRGQWAFCQTIYPGLLYDNDKDAMLMAKQTLKMIEDYKIEGEIINTGWMKDGLWNYFNSFLGHALMWMGEGKEMSQLLYDFAAHTSPTLVWREEQKPQGKGNEEVGDMPHNWASAEFIRMVIHMIALDRGNELHLFEGLPKEWTKANDKIQLSNILTPYGPIDITLIVDTDRTMARLNLVFKDDKYLPDKIVIHKSSWGESKEPQILEASNEIDLKILL